MSSTPTPGARAVNQTGSGDPTSPVLLHVPHAGTEIPAWTRRHIVLDDAELAAEVAALTDHRTDEIAAPAADRAAVRPWMLVNPVSRFVVDPERFPDEREEMAAAGMPAVYTRGTRGQPIRADDPAHRDALLAAFYEPWGKAVRAAVDARLAATGHAVLLDVHSYPSAPLPYELHADGERPAVCLGTDPAHTPAWLVAAALEVFAPLGTVGLNSPFAGTYVPLAHYGSDERVLSLMVELRRDLYLTEPDGPATAAFPQVVAALAELVNRCTRR
ncbi:N-formylglutamate amidohydrolase [Pseudonocardia aurantiaca]|uniref:N-formylglutamate amidohydrolase n=1 Tax=Pseudonocardia aurantiaca TaxID=75290 RepID=A0ABW4FKS0_9PSEU